MGVGALHGRGASAHGRLHQRPDGTHDPRRENRPAQSPAVGRHCHRQCNQEQHRRSRGGRFGRRHVQHQGRLQDPRAAAHRCREEPPGHTPADRHGRHPRLRDHLPHPSGPIVHLGPARHRGVGAHRGLRDVGRGHLLDFQPYGRHMPRPALGPYGRGFGRGPVARLAHRRGDGARLPGREFHPPRQRDGLRQAFRSLRSLRGRTRLQHRRHEPRQDV